VAALVQRDDYHVVALNQRGHGDSSWSKTGIYTVSAHMRDIGGFVNALDLRDMVLIGLSMGGRNAATYAALHPEKIARLVIVDIGPETMTKGSENIRRFTSRADILPSLEAFVERAHEFNPRRPLEQLRERLQWNLRQLPDGRWTWKYDRRFGNRERKHNPGTLWPYVPRIKAPTLLVRGTESDVLAHDAAVRFAEALPNGRLVEVEGAGHTVPGDNPPVFASVVREFLANA
jgi:pimeloyl-ACP methyl ester carboxylesterase